MKANVEDEDDPDVTKLFKAFKATGVNLIDEGQFCSSIFNEATLPGCTELLTEARL